MNITRSKAVVGPSPPQKTNALDGGGPLPRVQPRSDMTNVPTTVQKQSYDSRHEKQYNDSEHATKYRICTLTMRGGAAELS